MEAEKYGSPARVARMQGELDEARAELLRLVQIVCAGTPRDTYAAAEKLQAAAWQLAQLRRALEPQIQREIELFAVPPTIAVDRNHGPTITYPEQKPPPGACIVDVWQALQAEKAAK